jgi:FkbM family methyltransferase
LSGVETLLETGLYRLVRGRHGVFLVNPRDIYIGRSMVEYGEYSPDEWRLLANLIRPGAMVVEVGANIGALTVPLARTVGRAGFVWAYEPQPLVFQLLAANLALNDCVAALPVMAAVGGQGASGSVELARRDPAAEDNHGGIPLERLKSRPGEGLAIPLVSLDAALDPPRLTLLKADVEGMEQAVIEGASGLIRRHRPALYVENHAPGHSAGLISAILGLDYRLWWHLPPLFSEENFAGRAENAFGRFRAINMLCLPAELKTVVKGLRPVEGTEFHPAAARP